MSSISNSLMNHLPPDLASEGLAAKSDQMFRVLATESSATMSMQDLSDDVYTSSDVLIREDVMLEQGIDSLMMELGAVENAAESGIVGS